MLKAEHIKKTYNAGKKIALQDFSIEVPTASIYGLFGQMAPEKHRLSESLIKSLRLMKAMFGSTAKN